MKRRVVIAAPHSGSGKTMITCAFIEACKARKMKVCAFKCGPDYIDPMFHQEILGVPSKNLDLFFTDQERTRELFCQENEGDISVIEGVMGLYDGIGGISEEASTYHLAKTLEAPIILVVDAHGMGRSIIPFLKGFLDYDKAHLIRGVILNKTTKSFGAIIAPIIEEELGLKVLGFFPKQEGLFVESRHLGLTLPGEQKSLYENVKKASRVLEESVDLDGILSIVQEVPELEVKKKARDFETGSFTIGVAKDEAFCFYYEDNLRLLREVGADIIYFSPLHDETLPEGLSGLLLGGGYPELHLEELSQNESMKESIRDAILGGMPSLAECGGFMYLHQQIIGENPHKGYNMVGLLEGSCEKKSRLVRFGYASFWERGTSFLPEGVEIRGHEFHYYDSSNNGEDVMAKKPGGNRSWEACHVNHFHWWGFPHLYYESCPEFVDNFARKCRAYQEKNDISTKKS